MDIDSPSQPNLPPPQERILQKLHQCGVGTEYLVRLQPGLVDYVKENKHRLSQIIFAILPTDENLSEAISEGKEGDEELSIQDQFRESIRWLKWLMFENDPQVSLETLGQTNANQRGVCGAVWGQNDIAYRCRTCEHDQTCAICVTCFQNGNHKDHDYSLMYTGGGCCDCGDVTAWKREGFCSKHKGPEMIRPLSEEIANSVGPVLDVILIYWREKLVFAQTSASAKSDSGDLDDECTRVSNDLTLSIVEMLIEFCKLSESLLSFVSRRVFSTVGLVDVLVMAERFLSQNAVKNIHELLLKLLGEPNFKYEFAKVFIKNYPNIIKEAIKESSDNILEDKYPLLSTFSVQIFTVPTLTPRLVKEMNLLDILFGCIMDIFYSCLGEEGYIQVGKWATLYETTVRLVEDTRYVVSHAEVPKYVTHEQPDISRTWIRLLSFVQGVNPQKRVTGIHVEEESEHTHMPFVLMNSIANVNSLLVGGTFSGGLDDDIDELHHAKVGKLSQESSVCSTSGRSNAIDVGLQLGAVDLVNNLSVPPSVIWLTCECLRALENWLRFNSVLTDPQNLLSQDTCRNGSSFSSLKKTISRIGKGKSISKAYRTPVRNRVNPSSELRGRLGPLPNHSGLGMYIEVESEQSRIEALNASMMATTDMDVEYANSRRGFDDSILESDCSTESESLGVLSLSDWPEIRFDISSQDISVHIPLHRLLAMLLQKTLARCYGGSKALDLINPISGFPPSGWSHDFFGWILAGCHPFGFSAFLMEHPLRIRVFCAQVRAGMWRKNGDAAILSWEWYRSVRWSEQGLELDLFLLQCCAALAPPDLYVKRILDRFGLRSYLSLNLERSNEYEPILVQEMLSLIIQVIKERRFCGQSTSETLRRELIYKLAVGDATRSQLVKSLPRDISKNDQLQYLLDTIATYTNPSEMKQGKYSLRKSYWEELDLYHPRWSSRDLQVAEERYLRFCKVSASSVQLPRWTNVYQPLNGISRVATCRTVLEIVRAALFYAVCSDKPSSSRAPDGVLITALHLLSLALDVCLLARKSSENVSTSHNMELPVIAFAREEVDTETTNKSDVCKNQSLLSLLVSLMAMHRMEAVNNYSEAGQSDLYSMIEILLKKFAELDVGCMNKLKTLAPEIVCHLSPTETNTNIHMSDSTSNFQDRKAKGKERQAAILEKMRAAQSKFMDSLKSASEEDIDPTSAQDENVSDEEDLSDESLVCSLCRDPNSKNPVSLMVLLQKSRLASFVEKDPPSWEQSYLSDKGRNQTSEELVQSLVRDFSYNVLPEEVDASRDSIRARLPDPSHIQLPSTSRDERMDVPSIEILEDNIYLSVQKDMQHILLCSNGLKDFPSNSFSPTVKDLNGSRDVESALLGEYVAALSKQTSEQPSVFKLARNDNNMLLKTRVRFVSFDGFGPTNCDGIHISSCGHAVHQECRDRYLSSLKERYNRRIVFEGGHVVDPDQGEFLCPVCRRFANSVLPTLSGQCSKDWKQMISSDLSAEFGTVYPGISVGHEIRLAKALCLLQSASAVVGKSELLQSLSSLQNERIQPSLEALFQRLCRLYFPDRSDILIEAGRVSHSMLFWDTLKYSLISTEIAARGGSSSLSTGGSVSGITALYQELESSSGFILSLLLRVVQGTRSNNCLQVLQRFRGIQLFKESICSGVSMDETSSQKGNVLSVLEIACKGIAHPDIQFWRRAADPVLAHDPFSTLMWILFCLPRPFLSSFESFLSLVHLLYNVCVVQALFTCCGHSKYDITKIGSCDLLVDEICKFKTGFTSAQDHFVIHSIDSSCSPKEIIRLLSHPYLRRCALLWKLLKSSMPTRFHDRSHRWDISSFHATNNLLENTTFLAEIKDVEELENMFQIPNLDILLNNKELHAVGLNWIHHFCKDFEVRKYGRTLHLTPAVPFRLMHLPTIYQDLLERYIKQRCPECKAALPDPALCLLCGKLCSPSWKACCRESGCHSHAMSCGAGIGIFLLIRKTTILLQRSARHSPWPSPYLDAFGEEDIDMNRGKPLYLNEKRYAALTKMVASHGLDQSSEVLRQTTIDTLFLI
ncbi:RING-type E3 ubiquitin transferase [Ranunculus cassubicifolius]